MIKKKGNRAGNLVEGKSNPIEMDSLFSTNFFTWTSVFLLTILTYILRARLLSIPLERDEGGFAYMGWTWVQGTPLFSEYVDVKPPMIYILYGIFTVLFGENPTGIHTGLMIFNLGFSITFFLFLKKYYHGGLALATSVTYVLLSSLPNVFGFAAHATQLLVWPAMMGIWFVREAVDTENMKKMALGGLLLGFAFLIKQQAVGFMLLAGFLVSFITLYPKPRWMYWLKSGAILTFFAVLPYLLCLAWFASQGTLDNFWYWTYVWPSQFAATQTGNQELFSMMYGMVTRDIEIIWYTGLFGIVLIWFSGTSLTEKVFPVLLTLFGFLALSIGFHYYPHYFIVFLPAICLGYGMAIYTIGYFLEKISIPRPASLGIMVIVASIPLFLVFKSFKDYYFKDKAAITLRNVYGTNPFQESYVIGEKIKKLSQEGDSILVLGSEPQVLFYAQLPSISEHMHYYQLVDGGIHNDSLQQILIQKAEKSIPRFMVFSRSGFSWLNKNPENALFTWVNTFIQDHYDLIGVANPIPQKLGEYFWDESATYEKLKDDSLLMFERKKK